MRTESDFTALPVIFSIFINIINIRRVCVEEGAATKAAARTGNADSKETMKSARFKGLASKIGD